VEHKLSGGRWRRKRRGKEGVKEGIGKHERMH